MTHLCLHHDSTLLCLPGADFIECDVVLTKDLQPVCRHEPKLDDSTDAASKFPHLSRTYMVDGMNVTGVFSVDLTLAQARAGGAGGGDTLVPCVHLTLP